MTQLQEWKKKMLTKEMCYEMLVLQDRMNAKVNPAWQEANYRWTDAIMVEAVEAIEHYGWKWWKKQVPDIEQTQMELVDIWHFMLSAFMVGDPDATLDQLAKTLADNIAAIEMPIDKIKESGFVRCMREVISMSAQGGVNAVEFFYGMAALNFSHEELYQQYIAKNVLNMFRQDHGYKDGTYKKIWNGREDNQHLVEVMDLPRNSDLSLYDDMYSSLELRYATA